jgi:DHA1 family bicyclomycin/chloramphenicol resistance-like MFS transporter
MTGTINLFEVTMRIRGLFTQTFITMATVVLVIISTAAETDIFIPSFPAIQAHFATTESLVQMIISINFLGLCISALFYGPLSDSFGRRRVLLAGMTIFALSSIACVFATSITTLLVWRFIQGLGSSVAFVVPAAIIHDVFNKEKAAKMMGIYNSVVTFMMSLAPILGSYLYLTFNWHANFIFVATIAGITLLFAWCFIHETLDETLREPLNLRGILQGYKQLITHPTAMASLFIICITCGAYFAYISNLSLIFINHLGVPNDTYAYYQAVILMTFAIISFSSGNIIEWLGIGRTRMLGIGISCTGAVLLMLVSILFPMNAFLITAAMTLFTAGLALVIGILFGDYMNVFPRIKGIAASLSNCIRLFVMSVMIAISSAAFNGTMMPVAIIVFMSGVTSLAVLFWLQRQP